MKPDKERKKERKKNKGYDFIFSIGETCNCSVFLRRNNLQIKSYPFDWLANATLEERADLIISNFCNFFEKEDFQKVGESTEYNPCDTYKNTKTKIYHLHDFKHDIDFDISFKEAKEKYDRRIKRLYEQISSSKKVLAVYLVNPNSSVSVPDETLISVQKKLKNKFSKKQVDLLYIKSIPEQEDIKEIFLNDNIIKITANYTPRENTSHTPNWMYIPNPQVIKDILSDFYLNKNKYFEIRHIKKGFGIYILQRIFTIFILKLYLFGIRLDICLGKIRD